MNKKLKTLADTLDAMSLHHASNKVSELYKTSQKVYIVRPGDSLYRISGGDISYQRQIEKANPNLDPSKLSVGQKIILPAKKINPNQNMNPSQKLIDFLKLHEGKPGTGEPYLVPYNDGFGNVTAGWGHNYGKGNPKNYLNLTRARAEELLKQDIEVAASFIKRNINKKLTQGQFDSLTSIIFNTGGGAFYNSNLHKAIESGNFELARKIIPNFIIGKDQGGLIKRRAGELALFNN